jgi:hypothetical protein
MVDPIWPTASGGTTATSSRFAEESTTRAVMIFVRLATGRRSRGAFEKRTSPVSKSSRMAPAAVSDGARTGLGDAGGGGEVWARTDEAASVVARARQTNRPTDRPKRGVRSVRT